MQVHVRELFSVVVGPAVYGLTRYCSFYIWLWSLVNSISTAEVPPSSR